MMDHEAARDIFSSLQRSAHVDLVRSVLLAATRYAKMRADWHFLSTEERMDFDRSRTFAHNSFIDTVNALSRRASGTGESIEWRRKLGTDRRRIGDFACYVACFLGLQSR